MSLQEEIKKINERIEALNKDMQSLMSELDAGVEKEFPQEDDFYWYVDPTGRALIGEWEGFNIAKDMLSIGNVYQTENEAVLAVEKLKVEAALRKFSRPFKEKDNNYYIELYLFDKTLSIDSSDCFQTQGTIYFESTTIANEAIDVIGENRIKKYIFGVED